MSMIIKDTNGRVVVKTNDKGQIAIARFPDMEDSFKKYVIELYEELTGEGPQKLKDFLDYKSKEDEFCV